MRRTSRTISQSLANASFDISMYREPDVDPCLTEPLAAYRLASGGNWPCAMVPLVVDSGERSQLTAERCLALGYALGDAIHRYPKGIKAAVLGTGGMSPGSPVPGRSTRPST
ncbi:hypothetical protein [Streptomyces sp. UG1]|uniref:hypothetical protein n=1 Tax=Streptomyces sp. UG1 TaxID=3417652 RepID=UPI003CFA88B8